MIKKTLLAVMLFASQLFVAAAAEAKHAAEYVLMSDEAGESQVYGGSDDEGTIPDGSEKREEPPSGETDGEANGSETGGEEADKLIEPEAGEDGEEASDEPEEEQWIGVVTLTSGNLNVRSGPSLEDDIIGKLPNGTVIPVLEQLSEWVSIPYGSGIAYVSKPYLQLKKVDKSSGGKVIVLDPGHGGKDPGAILKDGTRETDIIWPFVEKAKAALESAGYVVHLTRDKNNSCVEYKRNQEDLACRAEFASKVGGDIFISIHADANPVKSFRGTVTFYNARSDYDGRQNPFPEESKRLAQLVQTQVQPVIGSKDRGIQNRNYYVNRMNTVPSVLLELAVLTNNNDLKLLKNSKRQDAFAEALVKAVDLYFQTEPNNQADE